jgi:hypothetical protein
MLCIAYAVREAELTVALASNTTDMAAATHHTNNYTGACHSGAALLGVRLSRSSVGKCMMHE